MRSARDVVGRGDTARSCLIAIAAVAVAAVMRAVVVVVGLYFIIRERVMLRTGGESDCNCSIFENLFPVILQMYYRKKLRAFWRESGARG